MNNFDRILWRINGILFLGLLVFGIVLCAWGASSAFIRSPREHNDTAIVNEAQGTHEKEFLRLGNASPIKGTSILRTPLYGEMSFRGYSSLKGESSNVRNYLFVNHSDLSSWWLFDGFNRLVVEVHDLRTGGDSKDKNVIGTIFEAIGIDTDDDHRLTTNDRVAAYFTGPDGKNPVEIVSSSDRILSVEQVTDNEALVIYQRGQTITAALFSSQNGTKIKESEVPIKESK